jgi:exosortase K
VIGIYILLKLIFAGADSDALNFLVLPTSKLIALWTGQSYVPSLESGYYFEGLGIVINNSCSGFNLWMIAFVALSYGIISKTSTFKNGLLGIALSLTITYLFTIVVNSFRIYSNLYFQDILSSLLNIQKSHAHEAIGVLVNLTFLITGYLLAEHLLNKKLTNEKIT